MQTLQTFKYLDTCFLTLWVKHVSQSINIKLGMWPGNSSCFRFQKVLAKLGRIWILRMWAFMMTAFKAGVEWSYLCTGMFRSTLNSHAIFSNSLNLSWLDLTLIFGCSDPSESCKKTAESCNNTRHKTMTHRFFLQ